MAFEVQELRGSLFENNDKKTDRSPDFTGNVKVDGKLYRIAGWWTKAKSTGNDYVSLQLSDSEEYQREQYNSRSGQPAQPKRETSQQGSYFERKQQEIRQRARDFKRASAHDIPDDDDIPF